MIVLDVGRRPSQFSSLARPYSPLSTTTLARAAVRPGADGIAPPVIAMGSGVTLTAVLRLLHRSGIPAFAVSTPNDFSNHSRWYRVLPGGEQLRPSGLKGWLDHLDLDGAVLLPCADDWVAATAALPDETARRFPSSVASLKVIETLVNKWKFARLLQQERLPHPDTRLLNSLEEMESLPERAFQQYILKPLSSVAFSQKYGVKGFMIRTREDARQAMQHVPFPI